MENNKDAKIEELENKIKKVEKERDELSFAMHEFNDVTKELYAQLEAATARAEKAEKLCKKAAYVLPCIAGDFDSEGDCPDFPYYEENKKCLCPGFDRSFIEKELKAVGGE